ncbi:MAG: DNA polymerase III subunit delta' [Desulfamplus sp.]|nr:DNA polymerase III subunit delta' [Desulfamplus sp.]
MEPLNELNSIILNNTIPNALLFTGSYGYEKKMAAMTFAKIINCLNRKSASESDSLKRAAQSEFVPCNQCRSCVKIDAAMHPDIITVAPEPEKSVIKIAQIRELCSATASMPHEAKMRMVLIDDAHTMNQEAANSLLKILEEPPERTFFVLIAKELNHLLPTIISRCRHLRFRPLSRNEVAHKLIQQWNIHPSVAMIAAKSSNGDIDKAMMFANVRQNSTDITDNRVLSVAEKSLKSKQNSETDWINRRRWLLNQLLMLIKPSQNSASKFLSALVLAEKLSKEALLIDDSLTLIKLLFRDMALIKYSKGKNYHIDSDCIVNSDIVNAMSDVVERFSDTYPVMALESLHRVETKLRTNASVRLMLESLFLSLIQGTDSKNVSYPQTTADQMRA